jgi:basic membrane protein A
MVNQSPYRGRAYGNSPLQGLERAVKLLGVQGLALTPQVREGFAPSLTTLARDGRRLVFAIGFEEAYDLVQVAPRFPHTQFVIIDTSFHQLPGPPPTNVVGLVFREQEVGYVVGYLAGLIEDRRSRPHIVSTVGGFPVPSVQRYIGGFQAGARRADPHIRLLNDYSNDFANTGICRRLATAQIARGSGVIFQVAGGCGLGALEAARAGHVFGIGVDTDESFFGPSVLTSALKRWDRAVFQTIVRFEKGTLPHTGDIAFGYRHGDLGLAPFSRRVPRAIRARVAALAREVAAGRIRHIPAAPIVR